MPFRPTTSAPLTRVTPEADFAAQLEGTDEAIVVGGHTHVQFDRRVGRGAT